MHKFNDLIIDLVNIKAIKLDFKTNFTWASGLKAPIYVDNRLVYSFPLTRKKITQQFINLLQQKFSKTKIDAIFGVATSAIGHAALLAEALNLPTGYVRKNAKSHGTAQLVEGLLLPNWNIILVEDLISTGQSVLHAVKTLQSYNVVILAVISIFSYELSVAINRFQTEKLSYFPLITFSQLFKVNQLFRTNSEKAQLTRFYKNWKLP